MPDPVVCLLCVCCVSVVCLCSMGSGPSLPEGVQVVVVGGGFGGVAVCQQLRALGLSFSLVDTRDAFHHNVAALRAAVQPGFARRTFIPYAETFGDAFVQGRVDRIDPDRQRVVLMGGRELQYSHLVLSTGSDGPFPGRFTAEASLQSGLHAYEDLLQQIRAADSVLVVGGGSTGVEMAAEIKTEYPEKKVVLVHSRVALADPDLEPSVRQQAKEVLLEKGVELLLAGSMAPGGALRVNAFLQVDGFSNVFAVGDCAHLPEPKLAYGAQRHAATAAANIHRSLRGEELIAYRPGNVTMLLAMGPDDGVGQLNGVRLPRCLVALGKSRDLLLWKSWREMGQKQP
ncbi:ferroptosis suppressor protein 1 isoform 4-T4 [Menidia menidia]